MSHIPHLEIKFETRKECVNTFVVIEMESSLFKPFIRQYYIKCSADSCRIFGKWNEGFCTY